MKNNLKVLRAMRNLKQEELAEAIGISRQAVVAMEANKYNCSIYTARRIAQYFGCRPDEIFFFDEEEVTFPNIGPMKED